MGTITFLLVLSFLVFFHELGHFLAAKYFGVKVHVFSIGFGKQVFAKEWKGTIWQLSLIPLGGYVKMKGQDDSNPALIETGDDSYNTKKPWQRIIILFAGPFANFLLAAILYFSIAIMGASTFAAQIGTVQKDSPAFHAGIQKDDLIVRINNEEIKSWDDIDKRGVIVSVAKGTYHEPIMKEKLKYAELQIIKGFKAREDEVQSGRADVFISDYAYGKKMLAKTVGLKVPTLLQIQAPLVI